MVEMRVIGTTGRISLIWITNNRCSKISWLSQSEPWELSLIWSWVGGGWERGQYRVHRPTDLLQLFYVPMVYYVTLIFVISWCLVRRFSVPRSRTTDCTGAIHSRTLSLHQHCRASHYYPNISFQLILSRWESRCSWRRSWRSLRVLLNELNWERR